MDPARWQRLSPLLDLLLDMSPAQREQELSRHRQQDPALADELAALLALEEDADDNFPPPLHEPQPTLRPGTRIGPYVLEHVLGEGGMGMVWRAKRAEGGYQRRVALKLLRPGFADHRLRLRFSRERDILARLEHPHIGRLLDAGVGDQGQPYLALEYVEGLPITDYCRQHGLALEARLALFRQVCQAVSHAHANLIVHRDLKPSNIMVTVHGQTRLLDFGIAKLLDTPDGAVARTELRAFTLHYAAPEQVRGEPVTTRTDVYALGVVLYEMLTGHKPYRLRGENPLQWEQAIIAVDPQRPSQMVLSASETGEVGLDAHRQARRLRGDLDRIVLKALAKRPEDRYPSVEALSADLGRHMEGLPVQAQRQSLAYRLGKYATRQRWWLLAASLTIFVLVGAAAVSLRQAREAMREAQRAQAMQNFVIGLFDNTGAAPRGDALDTRKLLEDGVARGERELAGQPLAHAELLAVVGRLRLGLGDYEQALALLRRGQALLDATPDPPAQLRLQLATQRGRALAQLDRGAECVAVLGPLEPLAQSRRGAEQGVANEFLSQYARCLRQIGRRDEARTLFEQVLARQQLAGLPTNQAQSLLDLAQTATDRGDEPAAFELYRQALAQLHGQSDTALEIDVLRGFGAAQRLRGETDAAQASFNRALTLAEAFYSPQHPTVGNLRAYLMALDVDRGRYAQAERQARTLLANVQRRLGPQHRNTGLAWNSLGIIAMERGDSAQALTNIEQAVAIWRAPGNEGLLHGGLFNIGLAQLAAGHPEQALGAFQACRQLRVERYGAQSEIVGEADRMIGQALADAGAPDQAAPWFDSAVRLTAAKTAMPLRQRSAVLAQARNRARLGQTAPAQAALAAMTQLPIDTSETQRLVWRARAYLAESRCNGAAPSSDAELKALQDELHDAQPEGGTLVREIDDIARACNARLLAGSR